MHNIYLLLSSYISTENLRKTKKETLHDSNTDEFNRQLVI